MNKFISVEIDSGSWPNGVPADISALSTSRRSTNVLCALMHTALWTMPPVQYDFDLSALWAWLRYGPAIDSSPSLKLRKEWADIDPHQKTVLSDELGIGFTTQLFAEELDFRLYADTQYVVNVAMPGDYTFKRSGKRGPSKSPDYLAVDGSGRVHVLECKGTQSSVKALESAIAGGLAQKGNLNVGTGTPLTHCLVAGLFIPQWLSDETALIRVCDPEPEELADRLANMNQYRTAAGIVQIALAKHFGLMGLAKLANWLATTRLDELGAIPLTFRDEADTLHREGESSALLITRTGGPVRASLQEARQLQFQMSYPYELYARLRETDNVFQVILNMATDLPSHPWKLLSDESRSELQTPLGFNMVLEWV